MRAVGNSQLAETMLTIIDDDVDELCTRTVVRMPIITPTTGFCNRSLCWKICPGRSDIDKRSVNIGRRCIGSGDLPVVLPPTRRNELESRSREQTKKKRRTRRAAIFAIPENTLFVLPLMSISKIESRNLGYWGVARFFLL